MALEGPALRFAWPQAVGLTLAIVGIVVLPRVTASDRHASGQLGWSYARGLDETTCIVETWVFDERRPRRIDRSDLLAPGGEQAETPRRIVRKKTIRAHAEQLCRIIRESKRFTDVHIVSRCIRQGALETTDPGAQDVCGTHENPNHVGGGE